MGQGGVVLGRRHRRWRACRQQGHHGQRKQGPLPWLCPLQEQTGTVGGREGNRLGRLSWSCPPAEHPCHTLFPGPVSRWAGLV